MDVGKGTELDLPWENQLILFSFFPLENTDNFYHTDVTLK